MPIIEKMVHPLLGVIVAHPRLVLALFLLCTAALGLQARHFEIDASADTLLMRDDPDYTRTQIVNRRFSPQTYPAFVPELFFQRAKASPSVPAGRPAASRAKP